MYRRRFGPPACTSPAAPFAHLAVTAAAATTWLHRVSDDDFRTPPHPAD